MNNTVAAVGNDDRCGDAADVCLAMSPYLSVEKIDESAATICLQSTGARLRIPRALYALLVLFQQPMSLAALAASDARAERAKSALENLLAKGFLVRADEPLAPVVRRLVTDPPVRLFDCPAHRLVPAEADVVIFGVPSDVADRAAAGARNGPAALREISLQVLYMLDKLSGRPQGWFDADRERSVLAGVSFGDCGDIFVDYGEPQTSVFSKLSDALEKVLREHTLPVLLGGDASICIPAIETLQARASLTVLRIGGAAQTNDANQRGFVAVSGLASRLTSMPGVNGYVQAGTATAGHAPGRHAITTSAVKQSGFAALQPFLSRGQDVYLGLDIGIVSPPGKHDDSSEGLSYAETQALLCAIGDHCHIIGIDLVGLNPGKPCWGSTAMTALHLLLTAISAVKDINEHAA